MLMNRENFISLSSLFEREKIQCDTSEKNEVEHTYVDHAHETANDQHFFSRYHPIDDRPSTKGGVSIPFPLKLHDLLDKIEDDGMEDIISWQSHGRCFVVHNPEQFSSKIMPTHFRMTKFSSFQRQLNLYGFVRLTSGKDKGGYYHELFLRGKKFLCNRIHRVKIKGTGVRKAASPDTEPKFYKMKPVGMRGQHDVNPKINSGVQTSLTSQFAALPNSSLQSLDPFSQGTMMNSNTAENPSRNTIENLRQSLEALRKHQEQLSLMQSLQNLHCQADQGMPMQDSSINTQLFSQIAPHHATSLPNNILLQQMQQNQVENTQNSLSNQRPSLGIQEEAEREFDAVLRALVRMPADPDSQGHNMARDNLGNLLEKMTE